MKIGRTALMLMAIGIPVVLLGGLGMNRSQQFEEQRQLREELVVAKQRLANLQAERLSSPMNGVEKELNNALSQLKAVKDVLSQPISSISVTDKLFAIADSCGVEIVQIDATGLTESKLNKIECSDISLTVVAEGELPNMIDFVQSLNNEHATGVVESAKIDLKTEEEEKPSVKIDFIIYSYDGE